MSSLERASPFDFSDIVGLVGAKRIIEIAVAGGHPVLLVGPPGCGKTMLLNSMRTIVPKSFLIRANILDNAHHRDDELLIQFIERAREPLEPRWFGDSMEPEVAVINAATMWPCKCGYFSYKPDSCACDIDDLRDFYSGSGVLWWFMCSMDMAVYISSSVSEFADFVTGKYGSQESSSSVSVRVGRAIKAQVKRCVEKGIDPVLNCFIDSRLIRELCPMNDEARSFIKGTAVNSAVRSAFDLVRCLRIARTIADLDDSDVICARHLAEAVNYLPRVFPRVFPSPGSGRIKHS